MSHTKENDLIVLGVTGGIAAYKAAELCSALKKQNRQVQVIMTANALRFVGEITFRTLSQRPVITTLWDNPEWQPEHVALANEAKAFIVAPATANFIAKMAHGIADDALSTFAATFNGYTVAAPAMNPEMYRHATCQANLAMLKERGVVIAGPDCGRVACGADGPGRLTTLETLLDAVL